MNMHSVEIISPSTHQGLLQHSWLFVSEIYYFYSVSTLKGISQPNLDKSSVLVTAFKGQVLQMFKL